MGSEEPPISADIPLYLNYLKKVGLKQKIWIKFQKKNEPSKSPGVS